MDIKLNLMLAKVEYNGKKYISLVRITDRGYDHPEDYARKEFYENVLKDSLGEKIYEMSWQETMDFVSEHIGGYSDVELFDLFKPLEL